MSEPPNPSPVVATWLNCVLCPVALVESVQARIKHHLGVDSHVMRDSLPGAPSGIYFSTTRKDVNLDFLRPDVLPPLSGEGQD